ncbi:hypothetical protein NPIL_299261 [Nephila pilipes]|uniref:Uncharacterized protein n=1 Tax=Nephila pilipes TaxID=299642 RepID=A0A8X6MNN0_NEPPI|nr:hypothetical protein NPIL_299261 [Nephila pilipes]
MWRTSDFGGRIHTSSHRYQVGKISLWVGRPNKLEQPFKESEQSGDYFKKQNLSSVEGGIPGEHIPWTQQPESDVTALPADVTRHVV